MWYNVVIGGLLLGATSSLHCVGMCGPISLALPIAHYNKAQQYFAGILYNLGRIIGYATIGILIGFISKSFLPTSTQKWLSMFLGIVIIIGVAYTYIIQPNITLKPIVFIERHIRKAMINTLQKRGLMAYFVLGNINALLPCGMVYIALAAALSFHSFTLSSLFMLSFGAGTLPLMLLLFFTGIHVKIEVRKYLKQLSPYAMLFVGVLLLVRGIATDSAIVKEKLPIFHHIISCF